MEWGTACVHTPKGRLYRATYSLIGHTYLKIWISSQMHIILKGWVNFDNKLTLLSKFYVVL